MQYNRITVFCASSTKVHEKYFEAARQLAKVLLKNKITAVYGGGAVGLMGELANYILKHDGDIEGVIPGFMMRVEWDHPEVKNMIVTTDMHERKKMLIKNTDAVVALPGGTGTVEELIEVISLKRLGIYLNPIIIVNTDGFYNSLLQLLDKMVEENFMRVEHLNMWMVVDDPAQLIEAINSSVPWSQSAINIAGL